MDIQNKRVAITGAGSGIGRALAKTLAPYCKGLAISDIQEAALMETKALCQNGHNSDLQIFTKVFDVSDREAMEAFAEESVKALGEVDILINNAGVALGTHSLMALNIEDFEWIFGINLWGVIYGTKAFLPHLSERPSAAIINISSVFGLMGVPYQIPYCTTKFAVRGFTESLRVEAIEKHPQLLVMSVHPGGIKTSIAKNAKWVMPLSDQDQSKAVQDFDKIAGTSSEKAAEVILKGIRKNRGRVLIGPDASLVSLMTRMLPSGYKRIVNWLVNRQTKKHGRVPE